MKKVIAIFVLVLIASTVFAKKIPYIDPQKRCGKEYQELLFSVVAVKPDTDDYDRQAFSTYPDLFKTHVIQACPNMRYVSYSRADQVELDYLYFLELVNNKIRPGKSYIEWNFSVYSKDEIKVLFGK